MKNQHLPQHFSIISILSVVALILLITMGDITRESPWFRSGDLNTSASLFGSKKGYNKKATPCIIYGMQAGWKFPKLQLSSDSLVVDSFFKTALPDNYQAWKTLNRDSCLLQKNNNTQVYAEYGTYTITQKGKKKFSGASNNRYLFYHRFK